MPITIELIVEYMNLCFFILNTFKGSMNNKEAMNSLDFLIYFLKIFIQVKHKQIILQGRDSNPRSSGYEPDEITTSPPCDLSIPQDNILVLIGIKNIIHEILWSLRTEDDVIHTRLIPANKYGINGII